MQLKPRTEIALRILLANVALFLAGLPIVHWFIDGNPFVLGLLPGPCILAWTIIQDFTSLLRGHGKKPSLYWPAMVLSFVPGNAYLGHMISQWLNRWFLRVLQ